MLQVLRLSLPYPVVQLWNELEDGQMVKFPAYDEKFGEVVLHAQRDGNERMEVEIDRLGLRGVENTYSAEINIYSVRQDSDVRVKEEASITEVTENVGYSADKVKEGEESIKNGHITCEGGDSLSFRSSPLILGTITPIRASTPDTSKSKKRKLAKPVRIKPDEEAEVIYEVIDNKKIKSEDEITRSDTEALQPVINIAPQLVKPKTLERNNTTQPAIILPKKSDENSNENLTQDESNENGKITKNYSAQNFERINKKGRGPPQYMCYLCEMRFVYLRSFQKHMDKHGVSPKEVLQAINDQRRLFGLGETIGTAGTLSEDNISTSTAPIDSCSQDHPAPVFNPNNSMFAEVVGTNETGVPVYEIRPNAAFLDKDCSNSSSPSLVMATSAGTSASTSPELNAALLGSQPGAQDVEAPVSEMAGTWEITEEGPYTCTLCERVFQYRTPFIRHINTTHKHKVTIKVQNNEEKSPRRGKVLHCPVCATKFCYQGPFAKHMHERHGMAGMEIQNLVQSLMRGDDPQEALQLARLPPDVQFSIAASSKMQGFQLNPDLSRDSLTGEIDPNPRTDQLGFQMGRLFTLSKSGDDFLLTDSQTGQDINLGESFSCHKCPRTFTYRSSFTKHLRGDHSMNVMDCCDSRPNRRTGKTFPCHLCSKNFMYSIPYQKHMETAHNMPVRLDDKKKSDFWCQICRKHFTYRLSYQKHLKNDHGVDPDVATPGSPGSMFNCKECQAQFTYAEALEIHKARRHSGTGGTTLPPRIKSVMQDIASWQESSKASAETIFIDEGADDYSSNPDGGQRACANPDDMGLSMINCKMCDKVFRYNMAFRKHMKKVHPQVSDALCTPDACGQSPGRQRERPSSAGTGGKIHGLLYGCSLCPYRSSFVSMVQQHVEKRHLVACKEAAVVLLQRNSINARLASKGVRKRHLCYECARGFSRKSLLLLHRLRQHHKSMRRDVRSNRNSRTSCLFLNLRVPTVVENKPSWKSNENCPCP